MTTSHAKKGTPVAVCTRCGKYERNIGVVNQQCYERPGGKHCRGVFQSAVSVDDWKECPDCDATGMQVNGRCAGCDGYGWRFIRSAGNLTRQTNG